MPTDLPPELLLNILSNLSVQSLLTTQCLSRAFRELVSQNENQVYRAAAILHGFVEPRRDPASLLSIEDIKEPDVSDWLQGATSWKQLCYRHTVLECTWTGIQIPRIPKTMPLKTVQACGKRVHRFKVDPVERTVISSSKRGGLIVASIDTSEVLWFLPATYVRGYSHIEYDQGYIIFDRPGEQLEVWRRSSDSFDPQTYLPCTPHPSQIINSPDPVPTFPALYPPVYPDPAHNGGTSVDSNSSLFPPQGIPRRGAYLPFALLQPPAPAHAYRFVHPHLVVASQAALKAFVWHIPSSTLVETIQIEPPPADDFDLDEEHDRINYVDISDDNVFICWARCIRVYCRRSSTTASTGSSTSLAYSMPLSMYMEPIIDPSTTPTPRFAVDMVPEVEDEDPVTFTPPSVAKVRSRTVHAVHDLSLSYTDVIDWDSFIAVHVSPDGRDLVAVSEKGWVVFVKDFMQHSPSNLSSESAPSPPPRPQVRKSFQLYLYNCAITYMAFDGTRILLATTVGLHALVVRDRLHIDDGPIDHTSRPIQVQHFQDFNAYSNKASCIQLLRGSAWMSFPMSYITRMGEPVAIRREFVSYIDFTDVEPMTPASITEQESDAAAELTPLGAFDL